MTDNVLVPPLCSGKGPIPGNAFSTECPLMPVCSVGHAWADCVSVNFVNESEKSLNSRVRELELELRRFRERELRTERKFENECS